MSVYHAKAVSTYVQVHVHKTAIKWRILKAKLNTFHGMSSKGKVKYKRKEQMQITNS